MQSILFTITVRFTSAYIEYKNVLHYDLVMILIKLKSFAVLFLLIAFVACDKDNESTHIPDYFPLSIGSYWIYNSYQIDSLGKEKLLGENDTFRIIGDTIIRGYVFSVYYGKQYVLPSLPIEQYFRDSSGYIVNEKGMIIFSQYNFTDTLFKNYFSGPNSNILEFGRIEVCPDAIRVPAGIFEEVYNCKTTLTEYDPEEKQVGTVDCLYAPDVGRILRQNLFVNQFLSQKKYYEERLVNYHIAR